ncbi:DUF6223 family protein [Sorangium sp. So ce1099]
MTQRTQCSLQVDPQPTARPREAARVTGARKSSTTRSRSLIRVAAAAALLGGIGFAAPAAAQGVIGTGSGRAGATVALVVGLIGVAIGGLALARSVGRIGAGNGRDGAIVALVLGPIGMVLAGLHLATATGGIGTGNGRGGAIVALVLGLIGMVLGRLALARSRRSG